MKSQFYFKIPWIHCSSQIEIYHYTSTYNPCKSSRAGAKASHSTTCGKAPIHILDPTTSIQILYRERYGISSNGLVTPNKNSLTHNCGWPTKSDGRQLNSQPAYSK